MSTSSNTSSERTADPGVNPGAAFPDSGLNTERPSTKDPYRVLVFPGGGLDAVMQLGVVHAILASRAKTPDMITGISIGALNAAAAAEVFQAGAGLDDIPEHQSDPQDVVRDEDNGDAENLDKVEKRQAAQVARFLEMLEAFRNAPATVLRDTLPDPYETTMRKALNSIILPRHFDEERRERSTSVETRTGLIKLLNGFLRTDVHIGDITRLVRCVLGWENAAEKPFWGCLCERSQAVTDLWFVLFRNIFRTSLTCGSILWSIVWGKDGGLVGRLCRRIRSLVFRESSGVEAAHIIFQRGKRKRTLFMTVSFLAGFVAQLFLLTPGFFLIATAIVGVVHLVRLLIPAGNVSRNDTFFQGLDFVAVPDWMLLAWVAASVAFVVWMCVAAIVWGVSRFVYPKLAADLRDRFLDHYHLLGDLGNSYAMKEVLVRLFDPNYYGQFDFMDAVHRGLNGSAIAAGTQPPSTGGNLSAKKRLSQYHDRGNDCRTGVLQRANPSIRVIPLAANLATGEMEGIPATTPVVDALMASCALVPFYRAQEISVGSGTPSADRTYFIDGSSVSNHPITETLRCLRTVHYDTRKFNDTYSEVRIYSVPLFPIENEGLPRSRDTYTSLVEVGLRALQLKRYQDALFEKELVENYNHVLPPDVAAYHIEKSPGVSEKFFFRTRLIHVTPDHPHDLNNRVPAANSNEERRALMECAVADGCRAMIQKLIEETGHAPLRAAAQELVRTGAGLVNEAGESYAASPEGAAYVSCAALHQVAKIRRLLGGDQTETGVPGISEICKHCAVIRGEKPDDDRLPRHIRLPAELLKKPLPETNADKNRHQPQHVWETIGQGMFPREPKLPKIIFLFSGGVFRGVFQIGFAAAVSELGIKPDVVAGSSVGTIVGALIGRIFHTDLKETAESTAEFRELELTARRAHLQKLAATFLCIDRFVLTDRFADFVRQFSIRASGVGFSLHDADVVFRRFDVGLPHQFNLRIRRVVAGIERLLYVSPFELQEFVEKARSRDYATLWTLFQDHVKSFFERYGVGLELLGPEPLQLLIDSFVFDGPDQRAKSLEAAGFGYFRTDQRGFDFLGTTTNLSEGRLEILSEESGSLLTNGLLASSAFPAVFRPRWSWELYKEPRPEAQYCDGGVLDNLPLSPVVKFLSAHPDKFERRPDLPHLILTASLEPEPTEWTQKASETVEVWRRAMQRRSGSWLTLMRRARELRYNGKIDQFQMAQSFIRKIIKQRRLHEKEFVAQDPKLPIDLDVLVVKPKWLCGTFAFHPMLGFRRSKQAESIAHGCAQTMKTVAWHFTNHPDLRTWAATEGIAVETLPEIKDERQELHPADLTPEERGQGVCFFRRRNVDRNGNPVLCLCPFHSGMVNSINTVIALKDRQLKGEPLAEEIKKVNRLAGELHQIYLACGRKETHERKLDSQI